MNSISLSSFHLPLNEIDRANQPPSHYLLVQDACILTSGVLWTIAYILYIQQAYKDKSYGMPIVALCANIGWELIYGVFYPMSYAESLTFVPWFLIDLVIVYTTIKFGPQQWKKAPLVANNLPLILTAGSVFGFVMHWALIKTCPTVNDAGLWSGFICQMILGYGSVAQIMSRNNTSGHSWTIWGCRWMGSLLVICMFSWRYAHYPQDYEQVGSPMTIAIFSSVELFDLTYLFLFARLRGQEKGKLQ